MVTIDTSAIANQLKRVYGQGLTDLFSRHTMTYNLFDQTKKKASVKPGGVGYYFGLRKGDIESVGARSEGQYLPEPLAGSSVQGVISPKLIYASLRLSGLAVEAGKSDVMAFVNTQGDAVKNAFNSLVVDLNRQCHGDGFGKLGTVDSATTYSLSAGATWDVGFNNDLGVRYMRKGMICDFYASGGGIDVTASSVRISSINPSTKVVTFEKGADSYKTYHPITAAQSYSNSATSIPAASQLVRYGARDASFATSDTPVELVGLLGHYDDGTLLAAHEGITVATHPEFKANILSNSSVNRELSIDMMLASMDMTSARSGKQCSLIRLGMGQRRKYFGLLEPDVRFAPAKYKGGYEQLDFSQNGAVKMIVDPMTQPNKMFFEVDGAIKKYELMPIGWGGFDPNKMHWRENYDEATMFLRVYTNLGVEERNCLTLLSDLTEPSSSPF